MPYISSRIQERLKLPKYFIENTKKCLINVSLIEGIKISCESFQGDYTYLERVYLETIMEMVEGKKIDFFYEIGKRDVENFLRDNNSQPAHEENFEENQFKILKDKIFYKLFESLFSTIKVEKLEKNASYMDGAFFLEKWLNSEVRHSWQKNNMDLKIHYYSKEALFLKVSPEYGIFPSSFWEKKISNLLGKSFIKVVAQAF